jgi:hypothetical protein
VKVNCREPLAVELPSVAVSVTAKLPSVLGVPEITPVAGSTLNPAGRPLALSCVPAPPPLVITWKRKRSPARPVALVPLVMARVAAGSTVIVSVVLTVPAAFVALNGT